MSTRRDPISIEAERRDPPPIGGFARTRRGGLFPKLINEAWASITNEDILPGELVFNRNDGSLVYRKGKGTIHRFDDNATRSI